MEDNEKHHEDYFRERGMAILQRRSDGSLNTQDRRFRATFGVSWLVVTKLWLLLEQVEGEVEVRRQRKRKDLREYLLWALMFLKLYTTYNDLSSRVQVDKKTYSKWVDKVVDMIASLENDKVSSFYFQILFVKKQLTHQLNLILSFILISFEKIKLSNRLKNDRGNDCLLSVDCVDFEINEPHPFTLPYSRIWYSPKFKGPGLRYEIALAIISGDIAWVNGPFPCGKHNDWEIFNKKGLRYYLEKNERVKADDGYHAGDPEVTKTPSGIFHPTARKKFQNRVQARQETVNKRFKQWGALGEGKRSFRHNLEKHQTIFFAISVITQLAIENGEPLFDVSEYSDD